MDPQEPKFEMNKDYKKLAQLCHIIKFEEEDDFSDIMGDMSRKKTLTVCNILQKNQNDIDINYQIPNNEYFKLNKPEWIGYTALHFAQEKRMYNICKVLIKFGADFTIKNSNGDTVLHQAAQHILKDFDKVWGKTVNSSRNSEDDQYWSAVNLFLLPHFFFKNTRNPSNKYGISHFHIACLINNTKVVQLFLNSGEFVNQAVNPDSPIAPGYTPLHFAVRFFHVEIVELLLKNGADMYLRDARKMSPLHLLIKRNIEIIHYIYTDGSGFGNNFENNKKMIRLFIEQNTSKDGNIADGISLTCFHAACTLQDVASVKKMFQRVSDLTHSISKDSPFWPGYTALHFAAHFDAETVYFLVNQGANLQVRDCQGVTPLDIFAQRCDISGMNLIIDSQQQWKNILFSDGQTKIQDLIVAMNNLDEFESFLKKVPDINTFIPLDSSLWAGYTPLHVVVFFCNSTNCFNFYRDTWFSYCHDRKENSVDKIKICLKLGCDVTVQDAHGSTVVHMAFHKKRMDIVSLLLQGQTKICNPTNNNGLSHLHIACTKPCITENVESELLFSIDRLPSRYTNTNIPLIELLSRHTDINIPLKSGLIVAYSNYSSDFPKMVYANTGSTPLHVAVTTGNFKLIKELLKLGADNNSKNVNGFTPIHQLLTVNFNGSDDYRKLKESSLLSDLKDCVSDCGLSHLHVACYLGNVEAVKRLLDCGANVNATIVPASQMHGSELEFLVAHQKLIDGVYDYKFCITSLAMVNCYLSYQPLHFAIGDFKYWSHVNYDVIDILLQRGANIIAKKVDGSIMLYEVLAGTDIRLKRMFIKELERNGEMQKYVEQESGITMLHLACAALNVETVVQLLNGKVNVNARVLSDSPVWPSCTPLHVLFLNEESFSFVTGKSTMDAFCTISKLLLDHGADILLQNAKYRTPLHQCVDKLKYLHLDERKLEYPKMLLQHHKDFSINPTDERGISHFLIACMCNDVLTVKSFLEHDVDVNQEIDYYLDNYAGYTPLHFAVILKCEETVHLLLQYGANVNVTNCLMETPLYIACRFCKEVKYLEILLNAGAEINERNIWGETPLEVLLAENEKEYSHRLKEEIVRIITKRTTSVNVFYPHNQRGFIGMQLCSNNNYEEILHNPVLMAVFDAPDENGVDSVGRNVIHNVVSILTCQRDTPSTDDYVKVIEKLARLGFDIDHRDKRGFTPLHAATKCQNRNAIESLLMIGADVNIKTNNTDVPFAYNRRWDEYGEEEGDWHIHKMFYRHFNKLSTFDLDLHRHNNEHMAEVCERYSFDNPKGENERHVVQVNNESNRLKYFKIEPYSITLYDFLSETGVVAAYPHMMKPEQEAVDSFFQEKSQYLRKNFPELTGILLLQYRKALARAPLIQRSATALDTLIEVELPYLCTKAVLRFLKNSELKKLIIAKKLCNPKLEKKTA